jgi:hypothetical protein
LSRDLNEEKEPAMRISGAEKIKKKKKEV